MKNFIIIILTLIYSCSNNKNPDDLWNEAQNHRINNNLKEAINTYKNIIDQYPKNDFSSKAQFQIADIYLNDIKDYDLSIKEFKIVVNDYPNDEVAKKSLFMIAYIYNNYINAYTEAIDYYNLFINKYPKDELIPSVQYELEGLEKIIITIDSLKINNNL